MRRLALFGGSFNPPHAGHVQIAREAARTLLLDAVLWMPARRSPFKSGAAYAEDGHRLAMVRLAAAGHPAFEVSTLELHRPPPSYTVDTLRELQRLHPDAQLVLLIGADSYDSFDAWHEPDAIRELAELVVYPRPGHATPDGPGVHVLEAELHPVSSSGVRAMLRAGESPGDRIMPEVRAYIERFGLYEN